MTAYVPLSVRHAKPLSRTRLSWAWKGHKERFALWLCPWLRARRGNHGKVLIELDLDGKVNSISGPAYQSTRVLRHALPALEHLCDSTEAVDGTIP